MKTFIKIILGSFLVIVLVLGVTAAYIHFSDLPHYETVNFEYTVTSTPEKVERGRKLATTLCVLCHMNYETGLLTGQKMLDAPKEFGEIYSQNITQDKTHGIGNWTDAELLYLLRTGILKDGRYSPPYMAKLPHMADDDIEAIIAFLRSDDPLVAPQSVPDTQCAPSLLTKVLSRVAFKPLPMPEKRVEMPDTNNLVEFGRYLAINLDCWACHSADFKTMNILEPELTPGYFGGGNKPLNLKGEVMLTSNLTPDKETGIGSWTEEQFIKAVKYGRKEGETGLRYPMMPFTTLTDYETKAIFEYLKTIPAINNKVHRSGLDNS